MSDLNFLLNVKALPLLPLRGITPFFSSFPSMPLRIGRKESQEAVRQALKLANSIDRGWIFMCQQKGETAEKLNSEHLYSIGMIAYIICKPETLTEPEFKLFHGAFIPAVLTAMEFKDGFYSAQITPRCLWFAEENLEKHQDQVRQILDVLKNKIPDHTMNSYEDLNELKSMQLANFCYNVLSNDDTGEICRQNLMESQSPTEMLSQTLQFLNKS